MDGEKEKERETGDEKECDETEGATLDWQEGFPEDDLGLPIMHWEDLSRRIAELEKQQEERKQKEKDLDRLTVEWPEIRGLNRHRETYEDMEDESCSRLTALTSRLQSQTNLQLCFINNSESEDEEEEAKKEVAKQSCKNGNKQKADRQPGSSSASTKKARRSGGFKNDVRAALSVLRHKLRLEQKQTIPPSEAVRQRKHHEQKDLKTFSLKELKALRTSLSKDVHDLSSELVARLFTRDQLRTEQDALLLEVQDMTSL